MASVFNYSAEIIGFVASVLGIWQFFGGRDKSQRIQELEERNSYLTGTVKDLLAGAATGMTQSRKALDHDRPRLQFKHMAHSYDRLRSRVCRGVTSFSAISCLIVLSIVGENYPLVVICHVIAVPLLFLLVREMLRAFTLAKLRELYAEASYEGDNDIMELQGWIGTQPWTQESTASTLNKRVMKW